MMSDQFPSYQREKKKYSLFPIFLFNLSIFLPLALLKLN